MASSFLLTLLLETILIVSVVSETIENRQRTHSSQGVTYDPDNHKGGSSFTSTSWASAQADHDLLEISEENRKKIVELAQKSLLNVLGLKEAPVKPKRTAFVPDAMLREYKKYRESVRDIIPDDRNFYGKIYTHEKRHTNYYSDSYNKYGEYGIEIDMEGDETGADRFLFKGEYDKASVFPLEQDSREVQEKWERLLVPSYNRGANDLKQSISVHLRFNLSQELFYDQEVKAAELHLSRERIPSEQLYFCDTQAPLPSSKKQPENGKQEVDTNHEDRPQKRCKRWPRMQRVYLYHVLDFTKDNEPMTRIHDTQLIDSEHETPLIFDVGDIIKQWTRNRKANHGLIVRVTYDEDDLRKMDREAFNPVDITKSKTSATDTSIGSAAKPPQLREPLIEIPDNLDRELYRFSVGDHVRLMRQFRMSSEADSIWASKQPKLYVFSDNAVRRHVKREYPDQLSSLDLKDGEEQMQADQPHERDDKIPMVTTTASASTTSPDGGSRQLVEHNMNRRQGRNSNGGQHRSRPATSSHRSRPKGKTTRTPERCHMKMLEINFDDVGWNSWIIAPKSYYLNYCAGDCSYPMNDLQNATNHAIIQSIFHSVGKVVPKSCCAPTRLGNMAILYSLDNVVQMRHYDDMTVESCGCV